MSVFAVIDTNVIVAALRTKHEDSATARVLDAIADGIVTPLYAPSGFHHDTCRVPTGSFVCRAKRLVEDRFLRYAYKRRGRRFPLDPPARHPRAFVDSDALHQPSANTHQLPHF